MELDKDFILKVIESESSEKKHKNKIPDDLVPTIYTLKTKLNVTYSKIVEMLKKEKQISVTIPSVAYRVNKFGAKLAEKKEKAEIVDQYPPQYNRPTNFDENSKNTRKTLPEENRKKNDKNTGAPDSDKLRELQSELIVLESKRGKEGESKQDVERRRELYELIRQEKAKII